MTPARNSREWNFSFDLLEGEGEEVSKVDTQVFWKRVSGSESKQRETFSSSRRGFQKFHCRRGGGVVEGGIESGNSSCNSCELLSI